MCTLYVTYTKNKIMHIFLNPAIFYGNICLKVLFVLKILNTPSPFKRVGSNGLVDLGDAFAVVGNRVI